MAEQITVEVVYAEPSRRWLWQVMLPVGSTVAQAIEASGVARDVPGLVVDPARLGIFSHKVTPDHVVGEGDRVEIYRPLTLDPKEARRRRAHEG
ncbi:MULTISPECIES: RnfH family protein [unclassified Dyella]|uniref:RnfH family protein n=1 Tax=unclassified Dyella TaxID=2634549 RepID=UPI000C846634|nr:MULTISPECIES: RnfH family protein [unclassified Dyella]MDR3446919.1 RnfH family protein [Dyella sp.]PMQ04143.1 Persistence and stress-resistance antitoxin PasI [Dyella sp. AD56]